MSERVHINGLYYWPTWFLVHSSIGNDFEPMGDGLGLEVSLKINGQECKVVDTLTYLESKHTELIKKEAAKLVLEQLHDLTSPIYQLLTDLKKGLEDKLVERGFEISRDY